MTNHFVDEWIKLKVKETHVVNVVTLLYLIV